MESTPSTPPSAADEKTIPTEHTERIKTHDRVPGHENYYEKDGLRTYGDGEDHDHEPPVRLAFPGRLHVADRSPDVIQADDVLDCHGVHLDWVANPRLYLW